MSVYDEIKLLEEEKKKIRSKSMFDDDFFGQIETLIEEIEEIVSKEIISNYWIEYTSYSNNSAKIKVNDKQKSIFKLINIKLTYRKSDIKFWYIHPEILSDEKWQKTVTYKLWKFKIDEHKKILNSILEKLIEVIEEY